MSSFNYWIELGYSPDVALKLSKSKNQAGLRAKQEAYVAEQNSKQEIKAPDPPKKTKVKGREYTTRDSKSPVAIKSKGSKRRRSATQRGTSQLTIPLNKNATYAGGLNV